MNEAGREGGVRRGGRVWERGWEAESGNKAGREGDSGNKAERERLGMKLRKRAGWDAGREGLELAWGWKVRLEIRLGRGWE